jgi:hypothetical protein
MDPELELLPDQLLKFYKREEHAEQLVRHGQLRVHLLQYFKEIEDAARRDRDEGEGRLRVPGQVPRVWISTQDGSVTDRDEVEGHFNFGTVWIHPTYVYCTSLPTVSRPVAREKFGQYSIVITEPALFARRLLAAFRNVDFGESEPLFLKGFPVQYSKDVISELPTDWRRAVMGFGQKPAASFEEEQEYRFAFSLSRPDIRVPEYLDLCLEAPKEFCERGEAG